MSEATKTNLGDMECIRVLDSGYLKYVDHLGDDQFIVECARMSTDGAFRGWDSDQSLLDYMYRNGHTSPFEFGILVVEVQAPIMVFRQWHRHRTFTYNEMSARYTELPNLYYLPQAQRIQPQSRHNKQGSDESFIPELQNALQRSMHLAQLDDRADYERLLETGISRELARINTPVSQYSRMRAIGNLHNWLHFLRLRMDEHAQFEIRQYANAAVKIISRLWPRTYNLFEEYTLFGQRFSHSEMIVLRSILDSLSPKQQRAWQEVAKGCLASDSKFQELQRKLAA